MQVKKGGVIIAITLMGAAMAMAFSNNEGAPLGIVELVPATVSDLSTPSMHQQENSGSNFDLSSIKRKSPKPNKSSELFQSKSWYTAPPPPKQAIALPPPLPTAPQLTFTYSGRMIDGDQVILFLSKNGRQYTAKVGDVLDDTYRLDKVTNTNALLTYLPMNIQQTLPFNSTAIGAITENEPNKNLSRQTSLSVSNQITQD